MRDFKKHLEVLKQEIKDWEDARSSYENTAKEQKEEEGKPALETLQDIARATQKIEALSFFISLGEKLKEEKIEEILRTFSHYSEEYNRFSISSDDFSDLAHSIIEYLIKELR